MSIFEQVTTGDNIYATQEKLIKEIAEIEHPEDDKELTSRVKEFVHTIIFRLILSPERCYGYTLQQVQLNIDWKMKAPMAVAFEHHKYQLYYNPKACLAKYTIEQHEKILIHECYHIINNHLGRYKDYKKEHNVPPFELVNICMDCAINQFINFDEEMSKQVVTLESFQKLIKVSAPVKATMEKYISLIMNHPTDELQKALDNYNMMQDIINSIFNGDIDLDSLKDLAESTDAVSEEMAIQSKHILETTITKCKGSVPGEFIDALERLTKKAEIRWQQLLRNYVGKRPGYLRPTPMRLNRRQPERRDLKGTLPGKSVDIVCAIDTSGSMSKDDLIYALSEVLGVVKSIDYSITVIECDAEIQHIYQLRRKQDINLKIHGRGGTCFTPVIEWVNENKDRSTILIYLTDGGGEYQVPKCKCQDIIWVLTSKDYKLSVSNPQGKVKNLRNE